MVRIETVECGGLTAAAEMLAIKDALASIWPAIQAEHPVDVLESTSRSKHFRERISDAISNVPRIDKKTNIILAGPELVALEAIAQLGLHAEVFVAVDTSFSDLAVRRVADNVPSGLNVQVTNGLPGGRMSPIDSVFLALGLRGGYRFALLPTAIASVVRRLAPVFSGERVLIDPLGYPVRWRRCGFGLARNGSAWVTEMLDSLFTGVAAPAEQGSAASFGGKSPTQTCEDTEVIA